MCQEKLWYAIFKPCNFHKDRTINAELTKDSRSYFQLDKLDKRCEARINQSHEEAKHDTRPSLDESRSPKTKFRSMQACERAVYVCVCVC